MSTSYPIFEDPKKGEKKLLKETEKIVDEINKIDKKINLKPIRKMLGEFADHYKKFPHTKLVLRLSRFFS